MRVINLNKSRLLTLVTGGARSGKSTFAEELVRKAGERVLYIATAQVLDKEMSERVKIHQRRRPDSWDTIEEPFNVEKALDEHGEKYDAVLIDCLTIFVSNLMLNRKVLDESDTSFLLSETEQNEILEKIHNMCNVATKLSSHVIVVTNEVGLGVVPIHGSGRMYRDLVGIANQIVASYASNVHLVVAGIPLLIKGEGENKWPKI